MAGRRRGRTGRGWDAAPPRPRRTAETSGLGGSRPATSTGPPPAVPTPPEEAEPARRDSQETTQCDPAEMARRDPAEMAREICLRQLATRPRTRAELAGELRRRGIADDVATEVLDRYGEVGMIDDRAFAQAWVSSRHHGRGLARQALGSELRQRGVAAETVTEALGELDRDTEVETARALVERKLRTASGSPEAVFRRLVGMLARKGYPAALAFRVVKEAVAADERTAELADRIDPDALAEAAGGDAAALE